MTVLFIIHLVAEIPNTWKLIEFQGEINKSMIVLDFKISLSITERCKRKINKDLKTRATLSSIGQKTVFWAIKKFATNLKGFKSYKIYSLTKTELNQYSIWEISKYLDNNPQTYFFKNSWVKAEIKRKI